MQRSGSPALGYVSEGLCVLQMILTQFPAAPAMEGPQVDLVLGRSHGTVMLFLGAPRVP